MGIGVCGPIEGPWGVKGPCDLKRGHLWPDMRFLLAIKGPIVPIAALQGDIGFANRFFTSRNLAAKKGFSQIGQILQKKSFGDPGSALEAPNHVLAPPYEAVNDLEWF